MGDFLTNAVDMFEHDGWSALADPLGAYDRADARHELAGRFSVVGEGEQESQNQVSAEHYEEIAKLYSDIRLGRTHIDVTPDELEPSEVYDTEMNMSQLQEVLAYRGGLMEHFADILQTEPGRELLKGLALQEDLPEDKRHAIEMSPFYDNDGTPLEDLDAAGNKDGVTQREERSAGATPEHDVNARIRPMRGDALLGFADWKGEFAKGNGLDALVAFNPGDTFSSGGSSAWGQEIRPDVMLFHELTHAYHSIHASMRSDLAKDTNGQEVNECELQAVGLLDNPAGAENELSENAYRQARRQVAGTPGAVPGDAEMPLRTSYTDKKKKAKK